MTLNESIILQEIPTKCSINTYLLIKDERCIYLIPDDVGPPKHIVASIKKCFFLTEELLVFLVTEPGTYLGGGGGEWCGCAGRQILRGGKWTAKYFR